MYSPVVVLLLSNFSLYKYVSLPLSRIREEWDSDEYDDYDMSDDDNTTTFVTRHLRRNTHTAKTAPARLRVRRRKDTNDDDEEDDDFVSLAERHARRQVKTGVPNRRQMLQQRRQEDLRAMESEYEKTEIFLRKLRQDAARERLDEFKNYVTQREFTAFLMRKIRSQWIEPEWTEDVGGRYGDKEEEGGERMWARSRLSRLSRRLGNMGSRMSGRFTPAIGEDGRRSRSRFFGSQLKKMLGMGVLHACCVVCLLFVGWLLNVPATC